MKGVCFRSVQNVEWQELPDASIEHPRDAVVRVELAGMCGSDLHPFFGREQGLDPGTVMGHEFVGIIIELGSEVKNHRVGDRVYAPFSTNCGECFYCLRGLTSRCIYSQLFGWRSQGKGLHGGQAEMVRVPHADGTLVRVPEGLTAESALLLGDNFSTGYFCAEMASIQPEGWNVILGCGTVGLLALQAARSLGAKNIVAIDRVLERRSIAATLGALVIEPGPDALRLIQALTDGRGADSVMELVGLPDAQRLAYDLLRPGGVMSVIGCHSSPHFAFSPSDAYDKNLTYRTGRCPARHYMGKLTQSLCRDPAMQMAVGEKGLGQLNQQQKFEIDSLITHRFQPDDCHRAYDIFAHQKEGCIKAVFEFASG